MSPNPQTPITLMLIEDNPIDVKLLSYALEQDSKRPVELIVSSDGEEAISWMQAQAADPAARKLDFVVLDLNLPKRDGTEVLQVIRSMKELQGVPVAVLSSSPTDVIQDRLTQAGVKADGHFEKSMDIDGLF